jgi:hypothetical protein
MQYRCEAKSVEGFIQQIAVSYVANGYWFYVAGAIPHGKEPEMVDRKIVALYGIDVSKWVRARRKQLGHANLQYIRFERFFLILATPGKHRFYADEANMIRDARRIPIRFAGYSISFRGGHVQVRIDPIEYRLLKAYFLDLATRRTSESLELEFQRVPFEPYAPVRRQLLGILRAVNKARKVAGRPPLAKDCLRLRRTIFRPFEPWRERKAA